MKSAPPGPLREPRAPRLPVEPLPTAEDLERWLDGASVSHEGVSVSRLDGTGATAREVAIRRFALTEVVLARSRFDIVTLTDGVLASCDLANADWRTVTLERIELRGCRLTGAGLGEARLHDVTFIDCQLDLAALRFSYLTRVRFEGCRLSESDFQGARIAASVLSACDLSAARLFEADFASSLIQDCRFDGTWGLEAFRGAELTWSDIIELAPILAARLGIRVHQPGD